MNERQVCAVIVSFHPGTEILENIDRALPHFQGMVVVDNGSSSEELALLRLASTEKGFALIELGENFGIGSALNAGVRWALQRSFPWIVLFDQDSTVTETYLGDLWMTVQTHANRESIALACPLCVDRNTGATLKAGPLLEDGGVMVAMTSGSLVPSWVFERCGFFQEELFIDQVDFEYCLRIRKCGYIVVQSDRASLLHTPGFPRALILFGRRIASSSHHNAKRRYYMTRNTIWVIRRYRKQFPSWCSENGRALFKDIVKMLVLEGNRWTKLRYVLRGAKDGLTGRLGKVVEI